MSANAWRWIAALGVGFAGGVFAAVTDSSKFPGWYELIRHGVIGVGPAYLALKLTLTKGLGN